MCPSSIRLQSTGGNLSFVLSHLSPPVVVIPFIHNEMLYFVLLNDNKVKLRKTQRQTIASKSFCMQNMSSKHQSLF